MGDWADNALDYFQARYDYERSPKNKKRKQGKLMTISKTQYVTFTGKAYWAKLYKPDEFRGAVRWTLNLVMDDPAEWKKFNDLGIQKKVNKNEEGEYFAVARPTTKMIAGKIVHFTPPLIYDKNGDILVGYYNDQGNLLRSYDDPDRKVTKKGDNVLIGNGSKVEVTLCVYQTAMGVGNRLESVKILDLIEYKAPEDNGEEAKVVGVKW